nr:uncharacterized protein LOC109150426 [Ipomoea batatas]
MPTQRIEGFDPNAYKLLAKSGYDPKEPQRLGKLILERVAKGFQDSMKFIQIRGWGMFHQNGQDVQENFWRTIRETLSANPINEISPLKEITERNIQLMKRDGVDLSVLEQRVANFFKRHKMLLQNSQEEYSKSQELLLDHRRALPDSNGQQDDLEITIKDAKKLIKRSKAKLKEVHDQKKNLEALIIEAQQ